MQFRVIDAEVNGPFITLIGKKERITHPITKLERLREEEDRVYGTIEFTDFEGFFADSFSQEQQDALDEARRLDRIEIERVVNSDPEKYADRNELLKFLNSFEETFEVLKRKYAEENQDKNRMIATKFKEAMRNLTSLTLVQTMPLTLSI